jgi:uncharacterized protein
MAAFALAAGRLESEWPLAQMRRLQPDLVPLSANSPAQSVAWSALGEQRLASGGDGQVWLHVQAQTALSLCCQRCLQPMTVELDVRSAFLFVQGEELAEQLDEHCEDNVLAITPSLDLLTLIEDELILALPLVPRHDVCPIAFPMSAGSDELSDAKASEHPFAALAPLLRRDSGDG